MKVLTAISLCLISFAGFSQSHYILTDTARITDVHITKKVLKGQCKEVEFFKGRERIALKPGEAVEYFIYPDIYFVAKEITINDSTFKAFVKRLSEKEQKLFIYEDESGRYFLLEMPGEEMVVLNKQNFRNQLTALFKTLPEKSDLLDQTRFTDRHLIHFIERVKSQDFSRLSSAYIAVEAGYINHSFNVDTSSLGNKAIPSAHSFTMGLTAVVPLGISSPVSFNTGVYYNQYHIRSSFPAEDGLQYKLQAQQIRFSLLARYSLQKGRVRPYFALGTQASFMLSESHQGYESVSSDSIMVYDLKPEGTLRPGACIGVEFELASQKVLYIEARNFYQVSNVNDFLRRNDFQLVMGFSL